MNNFHINSVLLSWNKSGTKSKPVEIVASKLNLKASDCNFVHFMDYAITEQQIKALDRLEDGLTWSSDMGCLVVTSEYIAGRMEQLRKGGE